MRKNFPYRLALDLGTTSLGWAMIRLDIKQKPCAIVKAGVRIFSGGRNPTDGSSLAVTRRDARAMRRRRDRLLKRKNRLLQTLIDLGFFPSDLKERKALERLDPYALRAKGLDDALTPPEFARALFHINQRRGFKSNRKTDSKASNTGLLKVAIRKTHEALVDEKMRTVGEWLYKRVQKGQPVRARYHEDAIKQQDGKNRTEKYYDLYIDRTSIEAEFDLLWEKQASLNPEIYTHEAGKVLKDILLYQRKLRPVDPGRCTLLPDEQRAPLALPTQQRFRIYQELNHLRILGNNLTEQPLNQTQRDQLAQHLDQKSKLSFKQIKKILDLSGTSQFNFEKPEREREREYLDGNKTNAILSKKEYFGKAWFNFSQSIQDEIVTRLIKEENEAVLITWLKEKTGIAEPVAERITHVILPQGYGRLSVKALERILKALREEVITYDKAVIYAGFKHHTLISSIQNKEEALPELPYYGEYLQNRVGFGTGNVEDPPEKRFGKIANPTVHIGLNQVRKVVNTLIQRYGKPTEVIVEVARDLKQSRQQRQETTKKHAENKKRNDRHKREIADIKYSGNESQVTKTDILKLVLWEELNPSSINHRCCPYTGESISRTKLLSEEVEIEHILPFSRTLDNSLNNKTVCLRKVNRFKGNQTPWGAFGERAIAGYDYQAIEERVQLMSPAKRYRFAPDGYQRWLKEDKDFLARALNDTRYLSRVAREYLSLICPGNTRVIPGRMTAMLRKKFGLNKLLDPGGNNTKNRMNHKHHAIDACVVGVTDQGLLQRFAKASERARDKGLKKLVECIPSPWPNYKSHVEHAIQHIWVSHKPDHGYEGPMFDKTIYNPRGYSKIAAKVRSVIPFEARPGTSAVSRHVDESRCPKAYKGLLTNSNYCIEVIRLENGKWAGAVVSTYEAYKIMVSYRKEGKDGFQQLRDRKQSISGKPLVMRLIRNDIVRLEHEGKLRTLRVCKISSNGQTSLADIEEANVDTRVRKGELHYVSKAASTLQKSKARRVTLSPIGKLSDPGFKE